MFKALKQWFDNVRRRYFGRYGGVTVPTPTPTPTPSATYDTTMGASVDTNGFTSLPLRPTVATRYYVKNSGSDANAGTNPTLPLATLAHAISLVSNGAGDQVLLAEGSTFAEVIPYVTGKSGYSATYPMVISSYDPADPTNEAKIGMGHQRGARPILSADTHLDVNNGQVDNPSFLLPQYIAIKGIDFNPGGTGDKDSNGIGFVGMCDYILIENNILRSLEFSFDSGEDPVIYPTLHKVIFRNNSSYGQWASGNGRTGGIYCAGVDGVTVEDNIFYHNGWKVGASRDDFVSVGGTVFDADNSPNVFSHPFYLQGNTNGIVRRNLCMEALDTATCRGNAVFKENVFLRCPTGQGLGDGASCDYRPSGISFEADHNLMVAAINLNSTTFRGIAWITNNGLSGSSVHHNLMIYSQVSGQSSALCYSPTTLRNQPSYCDFYNNVSFHWNPSGQTHYDGGGFYPAQIHTSYTNNAWDDPASGSNTNSSTFPNAYTESALYSALTATFPSITDYASLVAYVINHPEAHVQRTLRSLAFVGYGMTP